MKTNARPANYVQRLFNLFVALGLITMFLAPNGIVAAQTGDVSAPLFDQLKWTDLGSVERTIVLNDESVTLPGTVYQAVEPFNLENSENIADYYSTTNLANLGWQEVSTAPYPNGTLSVYFHSTGVYLLVEFVGCGDQAGSTCLGVWQSDPTSVVPLGNEGQPTVRAQALGTLDKTAPSNGATNVSTSVTLDWSAYTGSNLSRYRYCIEKTNDFNCDNWTTVWSGTDVDVSLAYNTKYYWQVQAVLSDNTKVDANSGTWWSFTTRSSTTTPPGAFIKLLPANGATNQSITPTLSWQASANAASYEYCVDTTNNNICDNNWVSTTSTSITLATGIGANITYYWEVRAINTTGLYAADTGNWAHFTTAPGPANDTIDGAAAVGVPYENIASTVSATLDTGTTNACSPALGLVSVWYKYAATSNRRIYLDTFGTSYDTFIAVWNKNANGTLSLVVCNDNSSGLTQSNVNLPVINGTTYYIQVAQKNSGSATVAAPGGTLQFHIRNFADVTGNNPFWKSIEGIYARNITGGCATSPDLRYCPTSAVTRASMAVFLLRGIHGSTYSPPLVGTSTGFSDVATTYWAAAWIKQLAAESITSGCATGVYCPDAAVTRAQMAIFLLRSKHGPSYVPPAVGSSTGFSDVATTYWAAAWIKQLAAESITSGCGAGLYCPESSVTRDQMAIFLSKTFGIPPLP